MKYVIIANGPFLPKEVIKEAIQDGDIIIAVDGAANKLAKMGFMPHLLIGDLDSIENRDFWGIPNHFIANNENKKIEIYTNNENGITIIHTPDQDATDLSKTIQLCDSPPSILNLSPATCINILCALDGRPDHSMGNLRSLRLHFRLDRQIWMHTDAYSLIFIKDAEHRIVVNNVGLKHQVAIMGMPEAAFTSSGLVWNGVVNETDSSDTGPKGYKVYPGHDSTCNVLSAQSEAAVININGEAIIMQPGIYKSQNRFENPDKQTERTKLAEQLDLLDYALFKVPTNEWHHYQLKRRKIKNKAGIKKYTNNNINKEPSFQKTTHRLTSSNMKTNRYYFLALPENKIRKFNEIKKHSMNSINEMNDSDIKTITSSLGYKS